MVKVPGTHTECQHVTRFYEIDDLEKRWGIVSVVEDKREVKMLLKEKKGSENKVMGIPSFVEINMRKAEASVLAAMLEKRKESKWRQKNFTL